ncbi:MAG: glucosamine-6-phosphate deaminase-like protein [Methanobacterium sp. PtaU1.Bin242]|nr:MAG: glucosamine-6-phosphate deaminase-like protein [Methanobacterium sp. PtaU1.Bin242]
MFQFNRKVLTLIAIFLGIFLLAGYFSLNSLEQYSFFGEINSSDRILIFSPHPDDESLGTGGLIKRAVERNATVLVVEMTNGDIMSTDQFKSYLHKINKRNYTGNIGDFRQNESINAIRALGLDQDDIIFLGYPDGGLKPLFEDYWDNNTLFHMNTGSNQFNSSPYTVTYESNAPYCGANVEMNVEQIIEDFKPNMIFYPDDLDYHPDHYATNAFVRYAMIDTDYQGESYTYLVHHKDWPRGICFPGTRYLVPDDITTSDAQWLVNKLNNSELGAKDNAIYSYNSQMGDMRILLTSFIKKNEIYTHYPLIEIEKVNGIESIRHQMPSSSYTKKDNNTHNGILTVPYVTLTAGIAYDDNYLYLLSKSDKQNFQYDFHLKLYNGHTFNRIDVKVINNQAEYESVSNNSIKSDKNLTVYTDNGIVIVALPINLFNDTKSILMNTDLINPLNKSETYHTSWRIFKLR